MIDLNVMYVDDDSIIRSIVKMTLQRQAGVTVSEFACGHTALEAGKSLRPDLILLDYIMPDMNGIEVLSMLRETEEMAQTPVIFVTSNTRPEEVRAYMGAGAIGVIPKPFDLVALPQQVFELWTGFQAGRQQDPI
jgi:CheY-like chemotaxis protein